MLDSGNNKIQWRYIVDLYEYQKKQGLTLANKLIKKHVMYVKNQMKVKLAVQVLSQSVANALLTMCEYLKLFDSLYDIMNSRTLEQQFVWRSRNTFCCFELAQLTGE